MLSGRRWSAAAVAAASCLVGAGLAAVLGATLAAWCLAAFGCGLGILLAVRKHEQARGLSACRAQFNLLLENAADGVTILDGEGRVRYHSSGIERLLGHRTQERLGRSALELVHPEDAPAVAQRLREISGRPGTTWQMILRARHRDGSWRVLEARGRNLLREPAVAGIVINWCDITERVREREREATRLAVARVLAESKDVIDATPRALEAICRCAEWDLGEVWCVDPEAEVLRWYGIWHRPGITAAEFEAVSRETVFSPGQGLPGRVWASGKPAWMADVSEDSDFVRRSVAAREGFHAALAFPVPSAAGIVATLSFFSRELREPDQPLLDMMAEIGGQFGQFVERAQAQEALRQQAKVIDQLYEAVATTDLSGIVMSWNRGAERLTGYAAEEILGRRISLLCEEGQPDSLERDVIAPVLAKASHELEIRMRRKSGEAFHSLTRLSLLRDADGRPNGILGLSLDISERKRAETALRESEERFRRLSDATSEGIVVHQEGVIVDVNENLTRMMGFAREDLVGRHVLEILPPESQSLALSRLASPSDEPMELLIRRRDGSRFWAEIRARTLPYGGGSARVALLRDVSERKRGEAELRKLSSAVEQAADTVVITDTQGRIEYVNPAFERFTGYTRDEVAGKTPRILKSGFHDAEFYKRLWETILAKGVFRGEIINRKKNGEIYCEAKTITPIVDAAGNITHFVETGSDVSERRRVEARETVRFAVTQILTESFDLAAACPGLLRAICNGMGWDLGELWLIDPSRGHLAWFDGWHVPSLDADAFEAASRDLAFPRGSGVPGTVWASGEARWVLDVAREPVFVRKAFAARAGLHGAMAFPIRGASEVNGVMVFMSARVREPEEAVLRAMADIGRQIGQFIERKRAELEETRLKQAVQRSAIEWRLTFDAIESPILVLDPAGRLVRLNRAAQERSGRGYDELIGLAVEAVGPAPPWSTAAALGREVAEAQGPKTAHVHDGRSGRTWDLAATWLPGGLEQEERIIVVASDVTRLMDLQESLRRSETMSAMGALVAGVAHEVRNPLFSISANVDVLRDDFGGRAEYREILAVLREELDRLSGLMQSLLEYGKPPSLELAERSLEDVVAQAIHACRPQATRRSLKIANEVRRGLPPVQMDRKRLVQVFQNLVDNAIQHSPPRGTVRVTARALQEGEQAWIESVVEDSGPGFSEEDLPRVFEPFFTRRRGGTGLGLSIAARIVEQHGGRIEALNRPEGGARMVVRLPCGPAAARAGGGASDGA